MAARKPEIFVSAVTTEFENARNAVAAELRKKGMGVRVQSDFMQEPGSDTTLKKLRDYIRDCDGVICIIGKHSGQSPPPDAAAEFAALLPQGIDAASYTQWEFFFARHYKRRRLWIYIAADDYLPERTTTSAGGSSARQQAFVTHIRTVKGYDYEPFTSIDALRAAVLSQNWPPKLTRADIEHLLHENIARELAGVNFVRTRGLALQVNVPDEDIRSGAPDGDERDALDFLNHWISDPQGQPRCALLGEHGMGKTVTALAFADRLLKARQKVPTLPLPIYLDLRHVGDAGKSELELSQILDLVLRNSWSSGDVDTVFGAQEVIRLVRHEGAIAIFDGLDEVLVHLSSAAGHRFTHEIFRILPPSVWLPRRPPEIAHGPGRVLVTCRTNYFRTLRDQNIHMTAAHRDDVRGDDYRVLVLLPFGKAQIRDYLTRTVPNENLDKLLENIDAVYSLSDLATRPYTLSLIAHHIPEIEKWKLKGRPITGVDLYRHVVLSWLERDIGKHQLTPDHKQELMEHFAAALWRSGKEAWTVADLEQWLIDFLRARPDLAAHYTGRDRELLKEDLRTATFLVREGAVDFRFAHTSLHEFFLASYLYHALKKGAIDDWNMPRVSRETLDFLGQLLRADESNLGVATLKTMRNEYRPGISEQAFDYALFAMARDYPAPSLAGFCLDGADLRWWQVGEQNMVLSLRGASFRRARLDGAVLRNIDADGADFSRARLARVEWSGGRARGANFTSADMAGLLLRDLNLEDADFTDVQLHRTRLTRCRLARTRGLEMAVPKIFFALCEPQEQFASVPSGRARLAVLDGHYDAVHSCVLASDDTHLVSAGSDGVLRVWDAASGECLAVLRGHERAVNECAVSHDGQHVASAGSDGTVRLWQVSSGECLAVLHGHDGAVNGASFSVDGHRLVSASNDATVRIWSAASRECIEVLRGHEGPVNRGIFSPDGQHIASAADDGTLRLWNATTGECLAILSGHRGAVCDCAFSLDGRTLASASTDKTLRIWGTASGDCLVVLRGHQGPVRGCSFSRDGRRLVSASADRTARVWDVTREDCIRVLRGHYDRVEDCAPSSDGTLIASASNDHTLRLWDADTGHSLTVLRGHENPVRGCAYDPSGGRIASAANDGTIRIWDASSGECLNILRGHQNPVQNCTFSADGKTIASASYDRTIRIWNARSGDCLQVLRGHEEGVRSCAFHPDGTRLASASYDRTLRVWNIASGQCLSVFRGHEDRVLGCAFSPDGRQIASVSNDRTLRIWDAASAECRQILRGHAAPVQGCAFGSSEEIVISASYDHTLCVWDVKSGSCLEVLKGHKDRVLGCALSLDGTLAASASSDRTLRIWNVASGECAAVLRGHERGVRSCAFSPDGRRLASSAEDGTVRLWDLSTGRQIAFQAHMLNATDFVSMPPDADRIIQVGGEAWRSLGWLAAAADGRMTRYPAETFGPLPECGL